MALLGNWRSRPQRVRHTGWRRPSRTAVAFSLYALFALVGIALPTSYIVQSPGPVLDVTKDIDGKQVLAVTGTDTHESDTSLLMTTVTATGNADHGVPGVIAAGSLLTRELQLVPVRALYPEEVSSADVKERNLALMDFSQDTAAAVAFDKAGMDVQMTLTVAGIPEDSPASGVLEEGDELVAISSPAVDSGKVVPIGTFIDLAYVLDVTPAGTDVKLTVLRAGAEHTAVITTRAHEPDRTGWVHPGSMIGAAVGVSDVELPADVSYVVDGIGGPSAGGMFTLAIYDAVTPGSLGGSATIAGTGAISWDGDILPIGGIRHKINGARQAGATDFLAPAVNCPETEGFAPDGLNLWAVRTIDEAISAVDAIGAGDTSQLVPCSAIQLVEGEGD
ncbi:YlbL family protein [Trueperella bialowiezensis]|uniref:endopeptidase La n=1 Tax=Trueperella bialowiezensis TaxID=312285 RepID=A0A448PFS1_9ACTO|nr:S16 family serine protease [Trueperella bialowiezensis]VEI13795.1 ATP-dependent protease Lon [Trueperella bialowiezensis]